MLGYGSFGSKLGLKIPLQSPAAKGLLLPHLLHYQPPRSSHRFKRSKRGLVVEVQHQSRIKKLLLATMKGVVTRSCCSVCTKGPSRISAIFYDTILPHHHLPFPLPSVAALNVLNFVEGMDLMALIKAYGATQWISDNAIYVRPVRYW